MPGISRRCLIFKMMSPIGEKEAHPKKQLFYKFLLLCILLLSYFSYLTFRYDIATGGIASALTWTFFVLVLIGYYNLVVSLGIDVNP